MGFVDSGVTVQGGTASEALGFPHSGGEGVALTEKLPIKSAEIWTKSPEEIVDFHVQKGGSTYIRMYRAMMEGGISWGTFVRIGEELERRRE